MEIPEGLKAKISFKHMSGASLDYETIYEKELLLEIGCQINGLNGTEIKIGNEIKIEGRSYRVINIYTRCLGYTTGAEGFHRGEDSSAFGKLLPYNFEIVYELDSI